MFKVDKITMAGAKELEKALEALADSKSNGKKWKRKGMVDAGKNAMKPVEQAAKTFAHEKTGNTKRSIGQRTSYKHPKDAQTKAFTKRGKLKKGYKNELSVVVTLTNAFNRSPDTPRNSKGKPKRYPFMVEVGVPPQTYYRKSVKGAIHKVNRKAPRKPIRFFGSALGINRNNVVKRFISGLQTAMTQFIRKQDRKHPPKVIFE